ncbi:MAG TPA: hypothetical protein VGF99_20500 [Myxococcota bacterium]
MVVPTSTPSTVTLIVALATEVPVRTGVLFEVKEPLAGAVITGAAVGVLQVPMVEVAELHVEPDGQPLPPVPRQPVMHAPLLQTMPEVVEPHSASTWQSC